MSQANGGFNFNRDFFNTGVPFGGVANLGQHLTGGNLFGNLATSFLLNQIPGVGGAFTDPVFQGLTGLEASRQQQAANERFQNLTQRDINLIENQLGRAGAGSIGNIPQQSQNLANMLRGLSTGARGQALQGAQQFGRGGPFQQQLRDVTGQFGRGATGLNQAFAQGAGGLNQAFQNRLQTGLGILEGAGAQERADINRQFNQAGAAQQAGLQARGLGGTTIAPAVGSQLERNRAGALGGLNERLLQQRLGTFAGLSGDALGAQERLLGGQVGLGAGLLGQGANLGLASTGAQAGLSQFQQGIQNQANQQNFLNQFGAGQFPIQAQQGLLNNFLQTYGPIQRFPPQQFRQPQF